MMDSNGLNEPTKKCLYSILSEFPFTTQLTSVPSQLLSNLCTEHLVMVLLCILSILVITLLCDLLFTFLYCIFILDVFIDTLFTAFMPAMRLLTRVTRVRGPPHCNFNKCFFNRFSRLFKSYFNSL